MTSDPPEPVENTTASRRLPAWLWIGVPLAAAPMQIAAKLVGEDFYRRTMRGETGLVENLTVLALIVAIVTALRLWTRRGLVASRAFGPFCLVMAAGCFFFAGEEASWGQHWFGFEVPEEIAARNDQGELNLHNDPLFEKLLDQPPRLALTLFALVGGVLMPLRRRREGRELPRFDQPGRAGIGGWIWPTVECLPAGLMVVTVSLPKKIAETLLGEEPVWMDFSAGETKELCLGLFLMIYLVVLLRELRATEATA